ncbi:substrate-binding periplasmic protein [Caldimonas brevitalea]|uniref:Solute-binding protein family 3/N-terminal domain-containing protein n=1 Tax=Caldimonas brevitalea TaxID=413882 RepID=A0A0G3BSX1_9BURK|nr:transporter substrate-binding domain-containing protein [Caldimonas brevitalea]AKJ29630.1 hypothetical protein AAW51_2939 [Caldimonas brevitalea]
MVRLCFVLATSLALSVGFHRSAADNQPLRIATGELPPYATQSRDDQGIALSIVRRAFELSGYSVRYTFLPWSRALRETRQGKWDGTAYWGRAPEREAGFLLSDTVIEEEWVFLHRRDVDFDWHTLDDLKPWRIAMIQDYSYNAGLKAMVAAGELHIDPTPDDLAALRKLIRRRVDVVPIERYVACDLISRYLNAADAAVLKAHRRPMTLQFTTHLLLPTVLPKSETRREAFDNGLKALRASGEYARLRAVVTCPALNKSLQGKDTAR